MNLKEGTTHVVIVFVGASSKSQPKQVDLVPRSWLISVEDQWFCHYPPAEDYSKVDKWVKVSKPPKSEWCNDYLVHILKEADSYYEGLRRLQRSYTNSNVESTSTAEEENDQANNTDSQQPLVLDDKQKNIELTQAPLIDETASEDDSSELIESDLSEVLSNNSKQKLTINTSPPRTTPAPSSHTPRALILSTVTVVAAADDSNKFLESERTKLAPTPEQRLDINKTTPRLDINQTTPRLDINKTTPRLDINKTTPRLDINKTTPRLDINKTTPRLDINKTTPRLDINKTTPKSHTPRRRILSNVRVMAADSSDEQSPSPPKKKRKELQPENTTPQIPSIRNRETFKSRADESFDLGDKLQKIEDRIVAKIDSARRSVLYDIDKKVQEIKNTITVNSKILGMNMTEQRNALNIELPVRDLAAFIEFDAALQISPDKEQALKSIMTTTSGGSTGVKEATSSILKCILGKPVQQAYSAYGRQLKKEKKKISVLLIPFHV